MTEMDRELDAEVAEKVMRRSQRADGRRIMTAPNELRSAAVPHYSTDMVAAWRVVERFRFASVQRVSHDSGVFYSVGLRPGGVTDVEGSASAVTASLAICRAALATVETPEVSRCSGSTER